MHENVLAGKSKTTGNRRALANISNIQKRPPLGGKKVFIIKMCSIEKYRTIKS